jgi:hypothetical protein
LVIPVITGISEDSINYPAIEMTEITRTRLTFLSSLIWNLKKEREDILSLHPLM